MTHKYSAINSEPEDDPSNSQDINEYLKQVDRLGKAVCFGVTNNGNFWYYHKHQLSRYYRDVNGDTKCICSIISSNSSEGREFIMECGLIIWLKFIDQKIVLKFANTKGWYCFKDVQIMKPK